MGLFGNKREKGDKVDKYEYHSSTKGGRSGYGPPALVAPPPPSYFQGGPAAYFDGYGQVAPQGKPGKYGKYGSPSKSLYGADPMQQAMLLPPQSSAALQAQAQAIFSMQQYMQGQGQGQGQGGQFAGIFPPIQMPMNVGQQGGLFQPQSQPFYGFGGQQVGTPFFDPNNSAFQQQQLGAFAPYQQQANFYDPAAAAAFAGPYGYMPAAY